MPGALPFVLKPSKAMPDPPDARRVPKDPQASGKKVYSFKAERELEIELFTLRERHPGRWPTNSDFFAEAILEKRIRLAEESGASEETSLLLKQERVLKQNRIARERVLRDVDQLAHEVSDAIERGMVESAHVLYAAQVEAFRAADDGLSIEWIEEAVKLCETRVLPLLPKRPAMNLRRAVKKSQKN